jgi:hypothetical protein
MELTSTEALLKERVLAAVAETPSLTRTQARWLSSALAALSMAIGGTLFHVAGGLSHSSERPFLLTGRLADGWGLAAAALTWLVGRAGSPYVRSPEILRLATLACPLLLLGWMGHFHGKCIDPPAGDDWPCFVCTLAMAVTPVICSMWLWRGVEPKHPATLAAAVCCACGAWAGVPILLWCPQTSASHALLGHAAPIALLGLGGSILGASALGIRRTGFSQG